MTLRPNDTVICVDDTAPPEQYLGIRAGETYTLRWVGEHMNYIGGSYIGVRLEGVDRGVCPQFGESDPPFRAARFRPVVKPKAPARELEEAL